MRFSLSEAFSALHADLFLRPNLCTVAFVAHLIHNVKRVAVVAVNRVEKAKQGQLSLQEPKQLLFRVSPSSFDISSGVGSRPSSFVSFLFAVNALAAVSRTERLTRIGLLSRRYLRSSPIIIGTAYVEKPHVLRNIEIVYRFYQPYAADLKQVVGSSPCPKASENAQNKFQISSDKPLPRHLVSRLYFSA